MHNAVATFKSEIAAARESSALYDYLTANVKTPKSFDDLLRFQVVYALSAFDKLMHDLIRIGMVQTFSGTRAPTAKYHAEPISLLMQASLASATIPPKELLFEQEVARKLSFLSFQDPDRVADGLALIWSEEQKWQKISDDMGWDKDQARKKLKLIATRRNAIVHEADLDMFTNAKRPISRQECVELTDFVELCGSSIAKLVT